MRAVLCSMLLAGCTGDIGGDAPSGEDAGRRDAAPGDDAGAGRDAGGGGADAGLDAGADAGPDGPVVDRTDPQLWSFELTAADADPEAQLALGTELAELDTRVEPVGKLVVYLHGAGAPTTCGSRDHGEVLAAMGFHVLQPCYVSDYGVGNCGDDIGGCRLEAFEGVDHHDFIDIPPPDSIERRVVRALEHLQDEHPGGDWQYFLDGDAPRWSEIVISGISHGASSSGLIGSVRLVHRVVMLSGPYDVDQPWLEAPWITPIDRAWGFTHTGDEQHEGHLAAFETLGLPGAPTSVDDGLPDYGGSHRLVSSAETGDGHSSVQAGGSSPRDGDAWAFAPVWATMYGP